METYGRVGISWEVIATHQNDKCALNRHSIADFSILTYYSKVSIILHDIESYRMYSSSRELNRSASSLSSDYFGSQMNTF